MSSEAHADATTPTPDDEEPVSITCGVIVYAGFLVWLALCAGGMWAAIDEGRAPAVDVTARCERRATVPCLSSVQARANSAAGFLTDSGVVVAELSRPVPAARRVALEYWAGDLVSVYDPAARMRYRTGEWEQGWRSGGPIALLVVLALLAALPLWVVVFVTFDVLRLGVRRLRPRVS